MSFKFGLNAKSKLGANPAKPNLAAKPKKKKPLFADSESDDDAKRDAKKKTSGNEEAVQEIGGLDFDLMPPAAEAEASRPAPSKPKKGQQPPTGPPTRKPKIQDDDSNILAYSASAKESERRAQEAMEVDASIYDYDAAYDALHAADRAKLAAERENAGEMKPKYMESLFESAEQRKKDLMRARDKLLQREREAEGDEFADKEKFVTGAYKAQQEENRKLEEEEKRKAEEDEEMKRKHGMLDFHKKMLAEKEKRHRDAMEAAERAAKAGFALPQAEEETDSRNISEADRIADLRAQGKNITLNDEGEVADRSELLSAGLNIIVKPKPPPAPGSGTSKPTQQQQTQPAWQPKSQRQAQRQRQTQMIAEQIEAANKRKADDEAEEQARLQHAAKSRKTEGEISSAKERYLQRKREKEEAAKAGAGK